MKTITTARAGDMRCAEVANGEIHIEGKKTKTADGEIDPTEKDKEREVEGARFRLEVFSAEPL